ncbi:MAG: (d)CMP kinase [Bacteroidales bacterium]|nr:(d)CMP kinase [Bacteroidales bacterium]MDD3990096.1 (d)CMP kinase [Bacteroidales bacterium]
MDGLIIAIDGHSSTGKSTFAKAVASKYSMIYVDTGALYRGVTLYAITINAFNGADSPDREKLKKALSSLSLEFRTCGKDGSTELYINGENAERAIRGLEVSERVSIVAAEKFVREYVDNILRSYRDKGGIVMDGRDIGTAVFPEAQIKVFMTARVEIRAERRYMELLSKGEKIDFETVMNNIKERDYLDEHRVNAPLKRAVDALLLDNSNMTVEQQMEWIDNIIRERWS